MNAFMYYVRRIDLLETFAHRKDSDEQFIDFAVDALQEEINVAVDEHILSPFQRDKLVTRLEKRII